MVRWKKCFWTITKEERDSIPIPPPYSKLKKLHGSKFPTKQHMAEKCVQRARAHLMNDMGRLYLVHKGFELSSSFMNSYNIYGGSTSKCILSNTPFFPDYHNTRWANSICVNCCKRPDNGEERRRRNAQQSKRKRKIRIFYIRHLLFREELLLV